MENNCVLHLVENTKCLMFPTSIGKCMMQCLQLSYERLVKTPFIYKYLKHQYNPSLVHCPSEWYWCTLGWYFGGYYLNKSQSKITAVKILEISWKWSICWVLTHSYMFTLQVLSFVVIMFSYNTVFPSHLRFICCKVMIMRPNSLKLK